MKKLLLIGSLLLLNLCLAQPTEGNPWSGYGETTTGKFALSTSVEDTKESEDEKSPQGVTPKPRANIAAAEPHSIQTIAP